MELRSVIYLHYINSLEGGLVKKSMNVSRGKPLLRFKALNEIYESEYEKNQNPDDEFEGFLSDRVKVERPTISDSVADDESNSDLDDVGTGMMTLKQIKEICTAKKRKRSKLNDSSADELCPKVKQEVDEDECDLMEPLITLKAKISKKVKGKTRCFENQVSVPAQSSKSVVKTEQILSDQNFMGSTECLPVLVHIKTEPLETACLDSQTVVGDSSLFYSDQVDSFTGSQSSRDAVVMATDCFVETQASCCDTGNIVCSLDDSNLVHDDRVDSCRVVSNEVYMTEMETEDFNSLSENPQPSGFSEEFYDCMEDANSEPFAAVYSQVGFCGIVPGEVTVVAPERFMGTENLTYEIDNPRICALNEVGCEYAEVEHDYSEPVQSASASCADMKQADIAEEKKGNGLDFPVPEPEGVDKPSSDEISQVEMLSNCHSLCNVPDEGSSPTNHVFPSNIDISSRVYSPNETTYGCFQDNESNVGSDSCTLVIGARSILPSFLETTALCGSDEEFSLASDSCFIPSPEDSPTSEEKQPESPSTCDVAGKKCLSQMLSFDAHEELTTSEGDGNCYSNLDPPPQRLLSTRKVITPDSQEKLCKAMESIDRHEEEHYRPENKLCFEQQNGKETTANKAERSGYITKIKFSVKQKQSVPKHKPEKRNGQTTAVPNGPHPSHAAPRFTTGCNSIESCSQSAIAFSQRQMLDIECLTTKLTNELKTMKEIAEEILYSEAFPATSLKYKPNEVRMAIKSATKVEQVATKFLSMMARDCTRFCKIMGLAEKDSDATETEVVAIKEKKKITFADETGAELCQVKFFEKNSPESPLEPDTTRSEVLS